MLDFYNSDCMNSETGLPSFKDNHFDLAIVDPPYGIGNFTQSDRPKNREYSWNETIPDTNYFKEIIRVSKERIIWGANYYNCFEGGNGAIVWDKKNLHPSMSRYEIASCSSHKRIVSFEYEWHGYVVKRETIQNIHPCQKPIQLYRWLLKNYAKDGDLILDTHVGSASSLIACEDMGFKYVGYEIDKDYYESASKRIKQFRSQLKLFHA